MNEAQLRPLAHVAFVTLLLCIAWMVLASCGRPDNQDWRGHLPEGRRVTYATPSADGDAMALAAAYALPIQQVETDAETGTAVWTRLDTNLMPDVDDHDWRGAALAFIGSQPALFGYDTTSLSTLPRTVMALDAGKTIVSFGVTRDGRPIRDAMLQLVFYKQASGKWRLGEWLNRSYAGVAVAEATAAALSFEDLTQAWVEQGMTLLSDESLWLPQRDDGTQRLQLIPAHAFRVRHAENDAIYTITVKDGTSDVLEAFPEQVAAFDVRANVYPRTYLDAELAAKALPFARLFNGTTSQSADVEGSFDLSAAGDYTLELAGKRARIVNNASTTPLTVAATIDAMATPLNFSEPDRRAVNTFANINQINKFVRQQLHASDAAILDQALMVKINVTGNCNAFYDPGTSSISLYAAGNNCANMANVNDVVYHEWGHGLDNYTGIRGGITDGAFSEGLADVLASYYVDSANMAPGFMLNDPTGIRNLKNTKSYPADRGEVHAEGQIIAGAFWDLHEMLIARYGATRGAYLAQNYFMRHLLSTDAYLDSYAAVLRLDDDDNNPATPSPNACLINAAFAAHGLTRALGCEDAVATVPSVDDHLYLSLKGNGLSNVTLVGSSPQAATFAVCRGGRDVCGSGNKTDVAFTLDGVKNNMRLFVATAAVNLQEQDLLTLVAKDEAGKVVGMRTVKVFSK